MKEKEKVEVEEKEKTEATDTVSLINVKVGGDDEASGFVEIVVQSGTASLQEVYETFSKVVKLLNSNVSEKLRNPAYR